MYKKVLFAIPMIACMLASCAGKMHYASKEYRIEVDWTDTTKDFRILQLCDIHLSQSDIYERHFKLIGKTIAAANADLIVLNGDSFTYADKSVVTKLFTFIDSYDIPWTFTYGNHDDQGYYADTYIQRILADKELFDNVKFVNLENDDVTGRSNFLLDIVKTEADGTKSSLFNVYCLESHSYNFDTLEYDFIKEDQIEWYKRMVKYETKNNSDTPVPSAMYFHIPLPEFFTAWNEAQNGSSDAEIILGTIKEFGGGPAVESDTHLFDVIKELGSTIAVSCAHDHINDSVVKYKDVALCFGVHSTDRIYYDETMLGGQVIVVDHTDPWKLTFENIEHSYADAEGK